MVDNCIFCKVVSGEIPSKKIMETDNLVAFLDVNPIAEGHTLIIPKNHYENIFKTPEEILKEMNAMVKKIAILLNDKLDCTGVNIINASGKDAQQSVFHIHYHVVPRKENDGLDLWFHGDGDDKEGIGDVYNKIMGESD